MPSTGKVRLTPEKKKQLEEEEAKKFKAKNAIADWKPAMPHLRFPPVEHRKWETMNQAVRRLISTNKGCEVSILTEGAVFKCHLLVLRTFCDFFAHGLVPYSMMKLPVRKVTADAFSIIYTWMTRDTCCCTREKMLDVLIAAEFLGALDVVNSIFVCFSDKDKYSEMNAIRCFLEARSKGIEPVAELMLRRVCNSFLYLVTTVEFLELSVAHLCILLASNSLGMQSEIEVFYASLMWLVADYEKRKNQMGQVFCTVRFKLMTPHFVLCLAERLHEFGDELASQLRSKLHLAMCYQQEVHMGVFNAHELAPIQRVWIRDPLCQYLYLLDENRSAEVTLQHFITYLRKVQKSNTAFLARVKLVENVSSQQSESVGQPSTEPINDVTHNNKG